MKLLTLNYGLFLPSGMVIRPPDTPTQILVISAFLLVHGDELFPIVTAKSISCPNRTPKLVEIVDVELDKTS